MKFFFRRDIFPEIVLKEDVAVDVEVAVETATTAANPVTFLAIALHPVVVDAAAVVAAETATTAVNQAISRATAPSREVAAVVVVVAAATATCNATSAKLGERRMQSLLFGIFSAVDNLIVFFFSPFQVTDTCPANALRKHQLTKQS